MAGHRSREGVVMLLLEREDISVNIADTKRGRTPLGWAAMGGYGGIVKLLLAREDTNPNALDTECGFTPLMLAAWMGHKEVVKLLFEREDLNPDIQDPDGETALQLAVSQRHEEVAKLLTQPRRSVPTPNASDDVPEGPGPGRRGLLQCFTRRSRVPLVYLSQFESLSPTTQALLLSTMILSVILSVIVICFFVFLARTIHPPSPPLPVTPPLPSSG